ncbi:Na+/H+ antiporter NhaC family protein [uncultured Dysosmobacter sp.]|uniref:Na+/H+ antiporter NhaC family protein n=1 Tax=uncultured Dysosmobacter sp. TaxID=2591384 RepID=UPI00260F897D|nr:Na+/H+ antiporter NhaC family protein [uncultured Dysosmobacter sp.]
MKNLSERKDLGAVAFIPLLTFLAVYLGAGLIFSIMGTENPFKQISREFAVMCGLVAVLVISGSRQKIEENVDLVAKHCGEQGVMLMILIFALAGAFSGTAKAMGGMDAAVNFGLSIIPRQFAFAGIFIISAVLATAMGTSMGTIAAIGPIALGIAEEAQLSTAIAIAAVLGGAMFGDNLSVISDTTIAATRGAGCEMRDKFKMNFLIALPAALISVVVYCLVGAGGELMGNYEYDLIKIIPYVVVLVTALLGMNVVLVLLMGVIVCGVIGFATGSLTFVGFSQAITDGISGMLSIIIVTIILRGLTGIAKEYGGIDWLVEKMNGHIHSRRGAEYGMSLLCGLVDMSMGNNTMGILVSAPLAMRFARIYNIAPKRVASLLDISSCVFQSFIPHGGQLMLCITLTGLSPFKVVSASYYPMLLAVATIITIQFGLLKTKEEKEGINLYTDGEETAEV